MDLILFNFVVRNNFKIMEYLDFEKPIEDLIEKLNQTILLGKEGEVDVSSTVTELEKKIKSTRIEIYGNLTHGKRYNCLDIHNDHIHLIIFLKSQIEIL